MRQTCPHWHQNYRNGPISIVGDKQLFFCDVVTKYFIQLSSLTRSGPPTLDCSQPCLPALPKLYFRHDNYLLYPVWVCWLAVGAHRTRPSSGVDIYFGFPRRRGLPAQMLVKFHRPQPSQSTFSFFFTSPPPARPSGQVAFETQSELTCPAWPGFCKSKPR